MSRARKLTLDRVANRLFNTAPAVADKRFAAVEFWRCRPGSAALYFRG
jgi:hypothetical protein